MTPQDKTVCLCGHDENRHFRAISDRCKNKSCKCPSFLNPSYITFLEAIAKGSAEKVEQAKEDYRRRTTDDSPSNGVT